MQFHEVSNIFPLMSEAELAVLANDIKANGLIDAIWTHEGKIVDGRNRYLACRAVGETPRFQEWRGGTYAELVTFVCSLNLKRRHLTSSQKAVIALYVERELSKVMRANKSSIMRNEQKEDKQLPEIIPEAAIQKESRTKAAQIVGTNPRYVSDAKRIEREAPDLIPHIASGEMNIPQAKREITARAQLLGLSQPHVAHNSGDNEWYTPKKYIDAVMQMWHTIDLDPASSAIANGVIGATSFYTKADGGLQQEWRGNVWMNPPYAAALIGKFCDKLISELHNNKITAAIVLVNNATETKWFHSLMAVAECVCFPQGRVKFWGPDNKTATPLQGQAIIYIGTQSESFADAFAQFGVICYVK